ncbi:MAG: endonuclease/exonuclease/phosphatase family protein [Puniceicoccaceae bacterium]
MGNLHQLILPLVLFAVGELNGTLVDGLEDDWPIDASTLTDATSDTLLAGPDFVRVSATNDAYNLYLLVEFSAPVNLRTADLTLLIDADDNPATGFPDSGRGMDFIWDFDRNRGTSTLTSRGDIGRGNLVERIAPDASATIHEIAISLEALPAAQTRDPVHIILKEENSRDRVPDSGSAFSYTLEGPLSVQPMPIDPFKDPRAIRIVSWNVLRDAPFKSDNQAAFLRILEALNPDIVLFQEFYDVSTALLLRYFQDNLQTASDQQWEIARMHDCITLSRFPIENSWPSNGNIVSRHLTGEAIGADLLIANNHFPCCENESGRVNEAANLIQLLGTRLQDTTSFPQSLIIGGDLNSGGRAPELIDLTTSLVPLEMASPRHLYEYDQYTWGSLGSFWGSSRLDFILFDPATLFRDKAFILDTDVLPSSALEQLNLEAGDTFISDHLVLVMDVRSPQLPEPLQAAPMEADGSTVSNWWGTLNGLEYPWIHHEDLGWMYLYESGQGYWSRHTSGIWFWTGSSTWPWIYAARGL